MSFRIFLVAAAAMLPCLSQASGTQLASRRAADTEWKSTDSCIEDFIIQPSVDKFYLSYLYGRLELGLRNQYYFILDNRQDHINENGEFTGGYGYDISMDYLQARQTLRPNLFGRYRFTRYVALEASWESASANVITYWDRHRDGILNIEGPAFMLVGRYPNEGHYTPFVGAGWMPLNSNFAMEEKIHQGIGFTRNIAVNNTQGFLVNAGCDVKLKHRVILNATVRYMYVDVKGNFHIEWYDDTITNERTFDLPMSNIAAQLGIVYAF
jgi:outer membrane protein W